MIDLQIDVTDFESRFRTIQENVLNLTSSLVDIGEGIDYRTRPFIPYERGYLENSYRYSIQTLSNFIEFEYGYTGRDNPHKQEEDYALKQNVVEEFNHPIKGTHHYLEKGLIVSTNFIFEQLESDYLSCFRL